MAEHGSTAGAPLRIAAMLARINRSIAMVAGTVLLATVALILLEIVLRQTPMGSLGGADEISGYVMAGVATWGFAFALTERAHVRIDILQLRFGTAGRALFDLLALSALSAVTLVVTYQSWGVLATTLARDSRANTPLATPLWIPQSVWFAGWAWLTLVSCVLLACVAALVTARSWQDVRDIAGGGTEEAEKEL